MKYLIGLAMITLSVISLVTGMLNMQRYGSTDGAPTFATGIIIGVVFLFVGVRIMLSQPAETEPEYEPRRRRRARIYPPK